MNPFPSPTLAPEVAQRLLADWDSTHDELRALIVTHQEREWTREEDLRHARLVRHIAVLSTTLHGDQHRAPLTPDERAWACGAGPHRRTADQTWLDRSERSPYGGDDRAARLA